MCLLAVIDTSIKSQGDASTDSKSRNFWRNFGDAFSAFQKTCATLSKVHVEVIIAATLLPTSVNFGDAFSAFQKTRAALSKGAASALPRVVQKAKGRRSEIEGAPAQKSKRRIQRSKRRHYFKKPELRDQNVCRQG